MPQQPHPQLLSNEANVQLAISAINRDQIQSICTAAKIFNISRNALHWRLNGISSCGDCSVNSKRLTDLKEQAITNHALDVDTWISTQL